jgi:hypothetical protein
MADGLIRLALQQALRRLVLLQQVSRRPVSQLLEFLQQVHLQRVLRRQERIQLLVLLQQREPLVLFQALDHEEALRLRTCSRLLRASSGSCRREAVAMDAEDEPSDQP